MHHPHLPGVFISKVGISQHLQRGFPQIILVDVLPDGEIPMHAHDDDAHMDVVGGSATIRSMDEDNGKLVQVGDHVLFAAGHMHGFRAGPNGLRFLSTNGGIVDEENVDLWDLQFPERTKCRA